MSGYGTSVPFDEASCARGIVLQNAQQLTTRTFHRRISELDASDELDLMDCTLIRPCRAPVHGFAFHPIDQFPTKEAGLSDCLGLLCMLTSKEDEVGLAVHLCEVTASGTQVESSYSLQAVEDRNGKEASDVFAGTSHLFLQKVRRHFLRARVTTRGNEVLT